MNDSNLDPSEAAPASFRRIDAAEAGAFAKDILMSATRTRAVVAVTTEPHSAGFPVDPTELAREVEAHADVVALETGDATWALSEALPPRLDVYGGAARIWWPGLSWTSDPYDHPLLFAPTAADRALFMKRIVGIVRDGDPARRSERPRPAGQRRSGTQAAPGDRSGQAADAWRRLVEVYKVGDVVRGRICRIEQKFVLVEVLPGVALLAPLSELDWSFVDDPAELFRVGDRVNVKILSLDPDRRRGAVSVKQAYATEAPLPAVSPGPGQPPFLADDGDEPAPEAEPRESELAARASRLAEELDAALAERDAALADRAELMKRVRELQKKLRNEERRRPAAEESDPTSSETAFLTAVRVEYARRFNESDRQRYPLQRMRVGREFLASLRRLQGVSVEKVVEVCAQVACQRAHEIPGREVHLLGSGFGGAPARTRSSDGAKAWRCSLQDGTPSARRLHWWDIPGKDGRTIEFASVAIHDDYSIPS